jgi:hypothetical protein
MKKITLKIAVILIFLGTFISCTGEINIENYVQITKDMSRDKVVEILGEPFMSEGNEKEGLLKEFWGEHGGSQIIVTFNWALAPPLVIDKEQNGL